MPPPSDEATGSKANQILDGALATFVELGFESAGVDEIARRARVSKPTLYHHFTDKRTLFEAVVRRECELQAGRIFTVDLATADIEAQLHTIGRRLMDATQSAFAQNMFRMIVSASARFPELGRVFYASGPDLGARRLAALMAAAVGRGELQIDDVDMAAHQFVSLCRGEAFFQRLLGAVDAVSDAQRSRIVGAAVALFLKAYRR